MPAPVIRQYVGPFGLTYDVPATFNRPRNGDTTWGNANGGVATKAKQRHLRAVASLLGLERVGTDAYRAVCGCIVAAEKGTGLPYPVVHADRALTEGDDSAPYAIGLLVPVCPSHNTDEDTRRDVLVTIRMAAERVARHYGR